MNHQGLQTYARQLAWEVLNNYPADFEQSDAIHEQVDSSALIIYYHKAWETVNTVREADRELFDRAEDMREYLMSDDIKGCVVAGDTYCLNTIITRYAYCILHCLVTEAVEELSTCTA